MILLYLMSYLARNVPGIGEAGGWQSERLVNAGTTPTHLLSGSYNCVYQVIGWMAQAYSSKSQGRRIIVCKKNGFPEGPFLSKLKQI